MCAYPTNATRQEIIWVLHDYNLVEGRKSNMSGNWHEGENLGNSDMVWQYHRLGKWKKIRLARWGF